MTGRKKKKNTDTGISKSALSDKDMIKLSYNSDRWNHFILFSVKLRRIIRDTRKELKDKWKDILDG